MADNTLAHNYRLTLVRHAKSSWASPVPADRLRPLNQRGRRDLPQMAARLAGRLGCPGRILVSPALRTRATAEAFVEALGCPPERVRLEEELYEADGERLLAVLRRQAADCRHLMVVGHMPGLGELARTLCGVPEDKFPTCAVLHMGLNMAKWFRLEPGSGRLLWYATPRSEGLRQDYA